jgi:predicted RNA-binding protein with TRAM domain
MTTQDLSQQVEQLENRVKALEGLFSSRVIDKEQGHTHAKEKDARDKLQVGETYRIFLRDVEHGDGHYSKQGIGQVEGIVTFVKPGDADVEQGNTVIAKITDVKENAAEAYAIKKVSS